MDSSVSANPINDERLWLQNFESQNHAWSSYHASQKRGSINICGVVDTILPLIREKVHTLATQYYCMNIISKTISVINPNQTTVDTCDQPEYALTKQIKRRYPELFGNSKYFSLFGGLHIGKALLIVHGEFIKGSGLDKLLGQSNLSITVMENTVVNVTDIKRCRYGLQVSACAIYQQLVKAFNTRSNITVWEWLAQKSETSTMTLYWKSILEMQIHILIFIRALRESNFELYVVSLKSLMKWFLALDHYNYARWVSVHLFDLLSPENSFPDVYQNFKDGHFSFQKSNREFSSIALDQVHEQNNAVLKSVAGVTYILNRQDESALLRWELCSHDLAKYLKDFEDVCCQTNVSICHQSTTEHHHEDTVAFKDRFINDVQQPNNSFSANPFTAHTLSPIDNLSIVYNDEIESNIKNIVDIGQRQFECYFEECLIKAKTPIDATIKSNSLRLPGKNFTAKKMKSGTIFDTCNYK